MYLKLASEQCVSLGLLQKETFAHFKAFSDLCADTCLQRAHAQPLTDEQGERLLELLAQAGAIDSDFTRCLEEIVRDNADSHPPKQTLTMVPATGGQTNQNEARIRKAHAAIEEFVDAVEAEAKARYRPT